MLPDRVSNPGPLTYESGALPIALRGPAYIYIYIYREREREIINQLCRKMPKNIFMAQLGFELTTSATPPSTALSVTSTDCAIETTPKKIVRIAEYTS